MKNDDTASPLDGFIYPDPTEAMRLEDLAPMPRRCDRNCDGAPLMVGPAYPYPIGARVALVDCSGGNRLEGEVTGTPGPWTIRVDTGRAVYLAAVGLVVERIDAAPETSSASSEVEKISLPPAANKRGQLSLF